MICSACGFDHEVIRHKAVNSLWWTVTNLAGYNAANFKTPPSPVLHKRVCEWLQERLVSDKPQKRVLIMLPRGHLKTSILTIGVAVWMVIRDRDTRGFILHKLPDEAKGFLGAVKRIISSDVVTHYFPELVPPGGWGKSGTRWTEEEIDVNRSFFHPNATIETKGLRSTIEGAHPIWAIADDLVDREVSRSTVLTQRAIEFRRNIGQVLDNPRTSWFMVVGTSWPGGFYEELMDDPTYDKLIIGCYQDERSAQIGLTDFGLPIWPEKYSREDLENLRREMTDYVFAHQYENRFTSRTGGFAGEDFRFFDYDAATRELRLIRGDRDIEVLALDEADTVTMTVDLATGAAEDETAIVVAAAFLKQRGVIAVLDIWHGRETPEKQLERMLEMARKWPVEKIGIERSLWPMIKPWWRRLAAEQRIRTEVVELRPSLRPKADRIWQLQPWVAHHRLFIRRNHRDLIDQFISYNPTARSRRDDIIDALAYQLDMWEHLIRKYRPLISQMDVASAYNSYASDKRSDDDEDLDRGRERQRAPGLSVRAQHGNGKGAWTLSRSGIKRRSNAWALR